MKCYGTYNLSRDDCLCCDLAEYCKQAKDPQLLSDHFVVFDEFLELKNELTEEEELSDRSDKQLFTREEVIELINFLVHLNTRTLEYLAMYFDMPSITLQEMGEERGVTKQAVHKFLKEQCKRKPELAKVMPHRK